MYLLLNSELPVYCERINGPHAVELFNTLSALMLMLPAVIGYRSWRRAGGADREGLVLVVLAASVSLSQLVVHGLRPFWTNVADQLSLALFAALFAYMVLNRLLGLSPVGALLNIAGFGVLMLLGRVVLPFTPAAEAALLAPPVLVMFLLGGVLLGQGSDEEQRLARSDRRIFPGVPAADKKRAGRLLLLAGLVLALGMLARWLDLPLCAAVPGGLHWLWHVAGGLAAALMVSAVLGRPAPARG